MDGVTVLSSFEVVSGYQFHYTAFSMVFAIFLISGVSIGAGLYKSGEFKWPVILVYSCIGALFGSMIGIGMGYAFATPSGYETHYKVIVSEEVTMQDFLNKYEILDTEGKMYIVREVSDSD